ncbi:hypothetical protein BDR26DRAFT_902990 [Obelidium mucronatum]|nr:hypothetical protein BDR26DRAFT_902990 [Obelidium mucronatum]
MDQALAADNTATASEASTAVELNSDATEQQAPVDLGLTIVEEGSADFPWLIERLANNVGFTSLSLSNANLSTDDVIAVAQALEVNTTLETLELEGNEIGSDGILALADAIRANKTLRELRIGTQVKGVSSTAERALAQAVADNFSKRSIGRKMSEQPTPEEIDQIVEELTLEQKEELAEKIETLDPHNLQALFDLVRARMPHLPDDEVELDIDALDNQTLWSMLEFVNRVIESEENSGDEFDEDAGSECGLDVSWLVDQLKANAGIITLQLTDAMLTTENVVHVAESLHQNTILECLDLEGNEIQAEGIIALAALISTNKTMKELRIGNQSFSVGLEAEKIIAKAMSSNYKMTVLTLNVEDADSRLIIEKSLKRNKSGFIPPRKADSPGPVERPSAPVIKRKSSIENWKSVKNMVWKFEGGESDAAAVSERRRTKVTVVNKGGRVVMEETVVNTGSSNLRSTLVQLVGEDDELSGETISEQLNEQASIPDQQNLCKLSETAVVNPLASYVDSCQAVDFSNSTILDELTTNNLDVFQRSVDLSSEIPKKVEENVSNSFAKDDNLSVGQAAVDVMETATMPALQHVVQPVIQDSFNNSALLLVSDSATDSTLPSGIYDNPIAFKSPSESANQRQDSATVLLPACKGAPNFKSSVPVIEEIQEVEADQGVTKELQLTTDQTQSILPIIEVDASSSTELLLLILSSLFILFFLPLSVLLFLPLIFLLRHPRPHQL